MEHRLIITADDYGICESVNRAIEHCIQVRSVLSTNVMANMPCAREAAGLKREYPYASVGIHYNFTVGKPLSPSQKVPSLVDEQGVFLSYAEIREKCRRKAYAFRELEMEMHAQYEQYIGICGAPDYWNTHENVHVYPRLYEMFISVSLRLGITKMRTHRRIYVPASNGKSDKSIMWTLSNLAKQALLCRWRAKAAKEGVASPDGLLVRMNEQDKLRLDYLLTHIAWKRDGVAEMVIHPSTDSRCADFGDVTEQRVAEYLCFSSPDVLRIANESDVAIVGFDAV